MAAARSSRRRRLTRATRFDDAREIVPGTTPQVSANRPFDDPRALGTSGDRPAACERPADLHAIERRNLRRRHRARRSRQPGPRIEPLDVSTTGVATGDHVTSIGYGPSRRRPAARSSSASTWGPRYVRSRVRRGEPPARATREVQRSTRRAARSSASSHAARHVRRTGRPQRLHAHHVFETLIAQALERGDQRQKTNVDGGRSPSRPVGGTCKAGSDCASGICVTSAATPYCTRSCGTAIAAPPTSLHGERRGRRR